jgi:hypothetical protein
MKDYIKEATANFGKDITPSAATPAKKDLFEIDENSGALMDAHSEMYHILVAKLLYEDRTFSCPLLSYAREYPAASSNTGPN